MRLPWVPRFDNNDHLYAQSKDCLGIRPSETHPCAKCAHLSHLPILDGIINRMNNGAHENTPRKWLGIAPLVESLERKDDQLNDFRLRGLNQGRMLTRRAGALDEHKRFVMAIASSDVKRLSALVRIGLQNGMGVGGLMQRIGQATLGMYRPRDYTQAERQLAVLLWKLGGSQLADIGYRTGSLPSISVARRSVTLPPLRVSSGYPTAADIQHNLHSLFPTPPSEAPKVVMGTIMMIDEIATERRMRHDLSTNRILGICREHGSSYSTVFSNGDTLELLEDALDKQKIHLASEGTVAALGALTDDPRLYATRPFLISGSCKKESAGCHQKLLATCIDVLQDERDRIGRVYCISADGEQKRGKALNKLTMVNDLPSKSLLGEISGLELMNYQCGVDDLTQDKDYKHNAKRLRSALIRVQGVCVDDAVITSSVITQHLLDNGEDPRTVDALVNPSDKQDVISTYRLLTAIARLPDKPDHPNPAYARSRRALYTLGRLYITFLEAYTTITLSLHAQLKKLSYVAHLTLLLYRKHKGAFMPVQLFGDMMHMVKNAYFCVAKTKIDNPMGQFWLILLGSDRLEISYGKIRTMVGSDRNLDLYQLGNRLTGATECATILAENPSWDRGARRITLPSLVIQGDDISARMDHINPKSWTGDVHVADVCLLVCWQAGRAAVEKEFPELTAATAFEEMVAEGIDILRPFGNSSAGETLASGEIDEPIEDVTGIDQPEPEDTIGEDGDGDGNDGLEEIEDLVAIALHEEAGDGKVSAMVEYRGEMHQKSSLLRHRSLPYHKDISVDRLRRIPEVAKYARANTHIARTLDQQSDFNRGPRIVADDPIATVLRCDGQMFLAMAKVVSLKTGSKRTHSMLLDHLSNSNVVVSLQVFILRPKEAVEGDMNDWKWGREYEHFDGTKAAVLDVPGRLTHLINPVIGIDGRPTWIFQTEELRCFTSLLYERVLQSESALKVPSVKISTTFPYRDTRGERPVPITTIELINADIPLA